MGRPRHVSYRRQAACPVSRRNPPCLLPRIFPFWKCVVHTSMPQDSGLLSRKRRTAGECRARPLSVHSPAVTDYDLSVSPASAMECFLPLRAPGYAQYNGKTYKYEAQDRNKNFGNHRYSPENLTVD